jgi:hypothetical protein
MKSLVFCLLILIISVSGLTCVEHSDCPDVSTCEIGACVAGNCTNQTVCTCKNNVTEPPYEECDSPNPLCSSDCESLGVCLRWVGQTVMCTDLADGPTCSATGGHFVVNASCEVKTACCDDGECSLEYPSTCFGFQGRPKGNTSCQELPDPCLVGACCSADLLYGNYQGCLPVFFESECCLLDGVLLEAENNCTRLGIELDDLFPYICDFGACVCTGALASDRTCTNTTKQVCIDMGCDWIPLSECESNKRGGRCGLRCGIILFLIPLFIALAACCCGCLWGMLFRVLRGEEDEEEISRKNR